MGINQFFFGNRAYAAAPEDAQRLTTITSHYMKVLDRFLHSLDMLQQCMAEWSEFFEQGGLGNGRWLSGTDANAGIHADAVFSYLNLLIDDIARLVPLVFRSRLAVQVFSGNREEALLPQRANFPDIEHLLNLDDGHSWWYLAFKRGKGVRQRLIHYPDIVSFQGAQREGEKRVEMQAFLSSPFEGRMQIDYFDTLRGILKGFCDWLDQLEEAFTTKVLSRAMAEGFNWKPSEYCCRVHLPIAKPINSPREIPEHDFLYLPLCEGSSSPKCTVQYRLGSSELGTGSHERAGG